MQAAATGENILCRLDESEIVTICIPPGAIYTSRRLLERLEEAEMLQVAHPKSPRSLQLDMVRYERHFLDRLLEQNFVRLQNFRRSMAVDIPDYNRGRCHVAIRQIIINLKDQGVTFVWQ